jgi:thioredoxin reductase
MGALNKVRDVHAIDGKIAAPAERFDVVVVGAGEAGTAAAIDAAAGGASVLLVDEHPVPGGLIGSDVPFYFGGRATAAVQSPERMVEQLFAANPRLEEAFSVGIDVRLGTVAWGLYVAGPAMRALPEPLLGIADAEGASMVGYGRLVLATGARDVVIGFPGWTQPGVMGAQGFAALVTRYEAFAGRRVLVVGSDTLGLETALLAIARGIAVAGIVEAADAVQGPAELAAKVAAAGIAVYLNTTIASADGGIDGVERVVLSPERTIECDTVVLAIGVLPATELLDSAGVKPGNAITLSGDCAAVVPPTSERLQGWAGALATHASDDTIVCQCEAVTRGDLLGVQPPGYLDRPERMAARSLDTLRGDGPSHPDQIKRLTRAGMGECQGRRCREQVRCLLARADGVPLDRVPVASFRAPVRPVPLGVLADWQESAEMARGWDVWFGIPTQWTPYAVIGTPEEADYVSDLGGNLHV